MVYHSPRDLTPAEIMYKILISIFDFQLVSVISRNQRNQLIAWEIPIHVQFTE